MTKSRIYHVTVSPIKEAAQVDRLVSATSATQALKHVAEQILAVELASQGALIALTKAGVEVEDAAVAAAA